MEIGEKAAQKILVKSTEDYNNINKKEVQQTVKKLI
jgi:hypothetical protein